jgi:dephospho-CoA kinase
MASVATATGPTNMHVFGLTGGIATGKSTIAAHWVQRGLPVVDADELARLVVAPGSDGLWEVAQVFGNDVLLPDGSLNRPALAATIFADPDARRALEAITHPRIQAALQVRMTTLESQGAALACYEAPLLVEAGRADAYRPLVVVLAPEYAQLERAARRDAADDGSLRARIAAQFPMEEKAKAADFVISNTGSVQALLIEADRVLDQVCARLGIAPSRLERT